MVKGVLQIFRESPQAAWITAVLVGGLIHLSLWPLSEPPTLFSDFYKAYWVAAVHLWDGGLNAGYPFTIQGNWTNFPILAWPFALLVPFGREAAGWLYLAVGLSVTGAAWAVLARSARLSDVMAALLAFFFLINGPLLNTLREGNSTHFVLLFLVLGVFLWQARRDYVAGLAFGMAAVIKPALFLIGVYFFLRRRWSIVAGGATTLAVAAIASLLTFGLAAHIQWFDETIAYNMGKAMPAFNVQSIDGFLIRLETGATELLYWGTIPHSLSHKIARYAILLLLLGGFGLMMLRFERQRLVAQGTDAPGSADFLQFSIVLVLALIISPVSWTHYYIYLLIPLAFYLGGQLGLPHDGTTRWLFWTGYGLTSLPVILPELPLNPDPPQLWYLEWMARTVISAWLFGALLMLAALMRGGLVATRRAFAGEIEMPAAGRARA